MINMKMFVLILAVLLMSLGCQRPGVPLVRAPFSTLSLPEYSLRLDAAKGDTLMLENGTSIVVPPYAFVNPEGKMVEGEVQLIYREMKNPSDILVSGIPMNTINEEKMSALESAIMWEVRAYQDSTELTLDSLNGKSLQTRIANNIPGSEYDLYYLDEQEQAWKLIAEVTPQENERYTEALMNGAKASRDAETFDLSSSFGLNYIHFMDIREKPKDNLLNYFQPFQGPSNEVIRALMQQKLKAYGAGWLEAIPEGQTAIWEDKVYPAALLLWETDKDIPEWLNRKKTEYLEVDVKKLSGKTKGQHTYSLTYRLSYRTKQGGLRWKVIYRMKAWPKMPLKDLYSNKAEQWNEDYMSLLKVAREEQHIAETQDRIIREFEIRRMGIYNYDTPFRPDEFIVKAEFELQNGMQLKETQDIFVLPEARNTVIRYGANQLDQFRIYPDIPVRIFTVGTGDSIYMLNPSRMERIDFNKLSLYAEKPRLSFVLEPTAYLISHKEDLEDFIAEVSQAPTAMR